MNESVHKVRVKTGTAKPKPRPFTVITSTGYWGKGHNPVDAAKNARIGSTWTPCIVLRADQRIVDGEINVNEYGQYSWNWSEYGEEAATLGMVYGALQDALKVGHRVGKGRIRKGKFEFLLTFDSED